MTYKRGDIVWLSKYLRMNLGANVHDLDRPYVIISNNKNNKLCPTVNLAAVTKQVQKSNYPMHVFLNKEEYELEYDSLICTEQVITVNQCEITDKIMSLSKKDIDRLNTAIYIQLIDVKNK